jgi:hypothetical protein
MSGHLQSCFVAFVLTGLSISPASSNPFTDLFNNLGSREATKPADTREECLPRPGKLAANGRRWAYHLEGRRKCWFQTAETAVASVKKRVHHYTLTQRVTARERREAVLRKRKADVDARAELRRSIPAAVSQPTPPAPELEITDTTSVTVVGAAAIMPPAPVAESTTDRLTPDRPTPRGVDLETIRVSPSANDTITLPVRPTTSRADGWGWTATWLGSLLMALGLVSLLSPSLPKLVGLFSRSE